MTNEERKQALLARWNAPGSKLQIRVLSQMDNLCAALTYKHKEFKPLFLTVNLI